MSDIHNLFDEQFQTLTPIPRVEGYSPSSESPISVYDSLQAPGFDITNAPSLLYLQSNYAFFNHGALVKYLPTPGDPVLRFCMLNKLNGPVFSLRSPFPILSGLGEPWDSTLIGCSRFDWPRLQRYLDTDTALLRDQGILARPLSQTNFPVVDFLSIRKFTELPKVVPTVLIELYGVDSNKKCLHFHPASKPLLELPKLLFDQPEQATVDLAKKLLSNKERPFE